MSVKNFRLASLLEKHDAEAAQKEIETAKLVEPEVIEEVSEEKVVIKNKKSKK